MRVRGAVRTPASARSSAIRSPVSGCRSRASALKATIAAWSPAANRNSPSSAPTASRAASPAPRDPSGRVTACPIREGDPEFPQASWDESLFENPAFRFRVLPGCRLGSGFLPEVTQPTRDTALMFRVSSGFAPLQASLGGLPGPGLVVAGGSVFATDAANGLVYEVDVEDMTTVSSRY